ncbi:glycosyltransferase family 2 protein, partial [Campylobacter coli]|nr:glycosyltransferase family 2 protein [Campylobacter coli]
MVFDVDALKQICQKYSKSTNNNEILMFIEAYRKLTTCKENEDYDYLKDYIIKSSELKYNIERVKVDDDIFEKFEILIPTYNRKEYVIQTVREIKHVNENIYIRISDNGSDDGTYEALEELTLYYPRLHISRNTRNMGLGFNLNKLMEECDKEFFVVTSDEDPIIVDHLIKAIYFCVENKIDALRPLCIHYNKYEARIEYKTYTIEKTLHDVATGGYLPGCVFNTSMVKKYKKYYNRGDITGIYEFNIWFMIMAIFGKSYFFNLPVQYHKFWAEKTFINPQDDISLQNSKHYQHPSMRWEMLVAFANILKEVLQDVNDKKIINKIEELLDIFSDRAINLLYNMAVAEFPKLHFKANGFIYQTSYQSLISKIKSFEEIDLNLEDTIKQRSARYRIRNHLAYKLGKAMIDNSDNIWGYLRMPFVLSYITKIHKKEQQNYHKEIKLNPNKVLQPLYKCLDYNIALKEKESNIYKLGQALIQANKNWYKGGYIQLIFYMLKNKHKIKEVNYDH